MKKQLLLIAVLLSITALALVGSAHGTQIQVLTGNGTFNPNLQKPISCQLIDGTILRTSGGPEKFHLIITRLNKQSVSISLPDDIVQVDHITPVMGNQVALLGMVNGSVSEVVLINILRHQITDQFLAYQPTISPDGRFIAFIKFYPPHFVEGTSDYVILYDVSREPASNRPADVAVNDNTEVGTTVYPIGIKTQDRNTGLSEAATNHVTSDFFWSKDSSKFVFSSEHELENDGAENQKRNTAQLKTEVSLVQIDLQSPDVPTASALSTDVCLTHSTCADRLKSVTFEQTGLVAQFQGIVTPGLQRSMKAGYDQFRAP